MSTDNGTAAYFNSLAARIGAVNDCAEIQRLADGAMAQIEQEISAVEAKLESLQPLQALLSIPTDLKSLITWAENVVTGLIKPLYAPYEKYLSDLVALQVATANLTEAIEGAAANVENCRISLQPPSVSARSPGPAGASAS